MAHHVVDIVALEVPIMRLMKMDYNRHDFARRHVRLAHPLDRALPQQMALPLRLEPLTEIIDMAEQFQETHGWGTSLLWFGHPKAYRFRREGSPPLFPTS